jgi:hypothetical protein
MRIYLSTLFILLCFSCNNVQNTDQKRDSKDSLDKPAIHSMKGFELYVWKKESDTLYTLLPGTNRNKTRAEIFDSKNAVKGMAAIKTKIDEIAPGEYIFLKPIDLDTFHLVSIKEYLKSRKLIVSIAQ